MPELPEVETTVRALRPFLEAKRIRRVAVRDTRLRWPVPADLAARLDGVRVRRVVRRAKYILIETANGTLLVHLGMSGRFRVVHRPEAPKKHEHIDIEVAGGTTLRYADPRRFGCFLWVEGDPAEHPLLRELGPEPWDESCTAGYLHALSRRRRGPVKSFLMDNGVIVGVGNIYANEALFEAGIRPGRAACRVSREEYGRLLAAVRRILEAAIRAGGTTLRDFAAGEDKPGYFRIELRAYGRGGQPCLACGSPLKETRIGGRSTVHCPLCQR
ncbi:MAG: bifunctional DNA-formamidopyrimidine glycosylase/DNA-(apurinic or apyrimidinic site) lyase [Pseudomonadota bacterium]